MRISGVRVFPVETPFPHRGGRWWMFVRLDTREGVSGYGEFYTNAIPFSWRVTASMVEDLVQRLLLEHDPYDVEALFQRLYDLEYSNHPDLTKLALIRAWRWPAGTSWARTSGARCTACWAGRSAIGCGPTPT